MRVVSPPKPHSIRDESTPRVMMPVDERQPVAAEGELRGQVAVACKEVRQPREVGVGRVRGQDEDDRGGDLRCRVRRGAAPKMVRAIGETTVSYPSGWSAFSGTMPNGWPGRRCPRRDGDTMTSSRSAWRGRSSTRAAGTPAPRPRSPRHLSARRTLAEGGQDQQDARGLRRRLDAPPRAITGVSGTIRSPRPARAPAR